MQVSGVDVFLQSEFRQVWHGDHAEAIFCQGVGINNEPGWNSRGGFVGFVHGAHEAVVGDGFIDEALACCVDCDDSGASTVPNVWVHRGGSVGAGADGRWEPQCVFTVVVA